MLIRIVSYVVASFTFYLLSDKRVPFFYDSYVLNCSGLAGSIVAVFILITFSFLSVRMILHTQNPLPTILASAMVTGGGAYNVFNMYYLGCVKDYMRLLSSSYFNAGDIFVVFGVLLLGFFTLFRADDDV